MNTITLDHIKKIDRVITRIRRMRVDMTYTPYFDQAIECLKYAKLQVGIDGANRDRLEVERWAHNAQRPGGK